MVFLKKYFGIFIVLLLSFWAIKPLFITGFFPMHDDTQVARVFEMGKMLRDGMFPVRWVPDLGYGYGYPIFNFYAPLSYYFGGFLTLLGFDVVIATKLMMVVGIVLSGIFMYLLAKEFWGKLGGIVSGLFFLYAPYHALDIYVRGDVAEFWAYAFIPLMFYGFYKVFKKSQSSGDLGIQNSKFKIQKSKLEFKIQKFGIIGALGFAGIILSHNLTALMITPFLLISFLIFIYSKKETRILTTLYLLLYTLLGLVISAFYWIPALLEMKYTNVLSQIGGGADFRDHFVCLSQLWDSHWGFGGSAPGCIDGLSFKIGKLQILLVVWTTCFLVLNQLFRKKEMLKQVQHDTAISVWFSIIGLFISVFLTLGVSKPIWETISLMAFLQYPWRFLLLASFFSSFISGYIIWFLTIQLGGALRSPPRWAVGIGFTILVFLLILFNYKLFNPQTILNKASEDYTNEIALKWTASKISDEFLPPNFKKPKTENEIAKNPIPFKETNIEKTANLISFLGIVIIIVGIIKFRRKLTVNE